jgi:predicted nucleic acid-binding protein
LFLIDTNILSEPFRTKPSQRVAEWLASLPLDAQYVSVLTLGELRHGIEGFPEGRRKEAAKLWLDQDVPRRFAERLLPVTAEIAERWGRLRATSRRTLPLIDSLLAATALEHGLRIASRNVFDFEGLGLEVVNPWDDPTGIT